MEERCARTHLISVRRGATRRTRTRARARETERTQTENTCIRKTFKGGESVSPGSPFGRETRYHVGGSGTPTISYLRKRLGKWSVEPKSLRRFSFSRERGRSRYVFFPPQRNDRRVAGAKGLAPRRGGRDRMVLFYFGQGRLQLLERVPLRGKSYAASTAREAENDFYPLPSSPRFLRPFRHVPRDAIGDQQLPNIDECVTEAIFRRRRRSFLFFS